MTDEPRTDVAWVSLGSNLGRRTDNLRAMRTALQRDGVAIEARSPELMTRAIGITAQPDFHNQVLRLRSARPLSAHEWLGHCVSAEQTAGRKPTYHWGPRLADVDILLLGEHGEIFVNSEDLVVPHPELRNRPFLMQLLGAAGFERSDG